ncbi:pyridoxamine 5'-phosphate oxidase family protein [Stappia indica]|uniref:pyridoxamine 5'-phosphate oxidase family protein n=1 Tax=Stappia indica TaxID=538381 RepID=UPI00083052ED|nr:pyridoxamine 5'-phosphate oxidase family protein [Stappia indica]
MTGEQLPAFRDDLELTLAECWRLLQEGATSRHSAFHVPTVATLDEHGLPDLRTMVLRAAEPERRLLRFHTDRRSAKIAQVARCPSGAIHIYDKPSGIQLRLAADLSIEMDGDEVEAAWAASRSFSRICYRVTEAPGREVEHPDAVAFDHGAADEGRGQFCILLARIHRIEWLHLAHAGHRRAVFELNDEDAAVAEWTGRWLVP